MTFYLILLFILLIGALFLAFVYYWRKNMEIPKRPDQGDRPNYNNFIAEINVVRDPQGRLTLKFPNPITINPNQQIEWISPDGQLEIRFSPRVTPFVGASFATGKGGKSFSGKPFEKRQRLASYPYLVLVTTSDGFLVFAQAEVRVTDR
ncbi:MAG: hypothetical protein ACREBD_37365 [Blastocatellia bacterium]